MKLLYRSEESGVRIPDWNTESISRIILPPLLLSIEYHC